MELSGKLYEGDFVSQIYKKGITFHYIVHIPDYEGPCGLNITHDGLMEADAYAAEVLAKTGETPHMITVGVVAGIIKNGLGEGKDRSMRLNVYDMVSPEYPNFVVEELLPFLITEYKLNIFPDPDLHMASGTSSGGISAWNIAWHRNDFFRRVYMSSPTFAATGGGELYRFLIRKHEPKKIRVYTDYSEHEPNRTFGSSYCADMDMIWSLEYAGYAMEHAYHPGEGHVSRRNDPDSAIERMRFLWQNWQTQPVSLPKYPERMAKVLSPDFGWIKTDEPFPEKSVSASCGVYSAAGAYTFDAGEVFFTGSDGKKIKVLDGFLHITALAISADKRRLYIADLDKDCVYVSTIRPDGIPEGKLTHGVLHHEPDYNHSGAYDLCVSSCDRVFAITELGIQSMRSFGLVDVIAALPDGKLPEKIEFGITEQNYLYALADGIVYKRRILDGGRPSPEIMHEPEPASYMD